MQTKSLIAVGCDIGGTSCKIGVLDRLGGALEHLSFPIPSSITQEGFRAKLFETIDTLTKGRLVNGVGILVPGYLNSDRTAPRVLVNLRTLEGAPLTQWVHEKYGVRAVLEIDRNAPALAEYQLHYRERVTRLLYVTIGTGLGVGLAIAGEICRICNGSVGELGHIALDSDGERCSCGNTGCAETLLSRDGIGRIAGRLGLCNDLLETNSKSHFPKALYDEAVSGNDEARRVFGEFGRILGKALVTYANILSPDIIIIGGGLSGASEFFVPDAERHLNSYWIERNTKVIPVRQSEFGSLAGIIGAASLVLTPSPSRTKRS